MWLLVMQRVHGGAPLDTAVLELLRGLPASFWPHPCKRVREWQENGIEPSTNTGAYNQARQSLPLSVVQQSCDRIFEELIRKMDGAGSESAPRAFVIDGTTMRTAHSPELCDLFPPGSNQHGEGHWPLMRVLVAHDVRTGLAMRPQWGAFHGAHAVSEQELLERAIDRLPSGSIVIGDRNFGVFSVAYAATQRQHPVLLRMTAERARRLSGGVLRDGVDQELDWHPSRDDRKAHPELPADASVRGRLIMRQVRPNNGAAPILLVLFTTLSSSAQELVELYGLRWAIETDLRTLKKTLRLDQLTCSTPNMVAKDIDMAIGAYNLVRAMIALASQRSGIPPRGYSFTKVLRILQIFSPALANAPDRQAAERIFAQMNRYVDQSKLPHRKRKRPSYPRQVYKRGATYPSRTE